MSGFDLRSEPGADCRIGEGATFDAYIDGDEIVFELHGGEDQKMPEGMMTRVIETGKTEVFEDRGYTFEVSPMTFPGNGEPGVSMKTIKRPDNDRPSHRDTFYKICKTGRGLFLAAAIEAAFEAEPVEKMDE